MTDPSNDSTRRSAQARPTPHRRGPHARPGFTLVELLVVIGIIVVLAGILLPVLAEARKRARENACSNNLRQIYMGTNLASIDHGGRFPRPPSRHHTKAWANTEKIIDLVFAMDAAGGGGGMIDFYTGILWPYVGVSPDARAELLSCPHDRGEIAQGGSTATYNRNFSYSFNSNIRPEEKGYTLQLKQIRQPSQKIFIWEELGPNDGWCTGPGGGDDHPTNRHGRSGVVGRQVAGVIADPNWAKEGYGMYCFFDGHVEALGADHLIRNGARYHSNITQ